MAVKKAFIHIGSPKTGTTAIQSFCALNAARLAQLDIAYPFELLRDPNRIGGQAHHCLVNVFMDATTFWNSINLRPKDMKDEDIISYLKSMSREKNIVLSTENLVWLDKKAINTLKEYLDGFDVYVVLYVRRQDDALQALYQTVVTLIGETRQFKEYTNNALTLFEYDKIAEAWQSVFGIGKVVIRVYERGQLYDGDVVSDFITVLEGILQIKINSSNWDRNIGTVNRGLPAHITALIRYSNNFPSKRFIVLVIRRIAGLLYKESRGSYEIISPSARSELLEIFAKSNENLARKFLQRKDGLLFHDLAITQTDEEWNAKNTQRYGHIKLLLHDIFSRLQPQNRSL